jgi:hypothetical protein
MTSNSSSISNIIEIDSLPFLIHLASNPVEYRRPCNQLASDESVEPSTIHFIFSPENERSVVEITEQRFSKAGLGFRVFPSAVILAAIFDLNPEIVLRRRVLELGRSSVQFRDIHCNSDYT